MKILLQKGYCPIFSLLSARNTLQSLIYIPGTTSHKLWLLSQPTFKFAGKVYILWEGHKILRNLQQLVVLCTYCRLNDWWRLDFAKFCGLFRIYELERFQNLIRYVQFHLQKKMNEVSLCQLFLHNSTSWQTVTSFNKMSSKIYSSLLHVQNWIMYDSNKYVLFLISLIL